MRAYDLDVSACEAGVVEGQNSLNNELYGCVFKGRAAGTTGLRTLGGGSLRMFSGAFIQFEESAVRIDTRRGVAVLASGVHVEKCGAAGAVGLAASFVAGGDLTVCLVSLWTAATFVALAAPMILEAVFPGRDHDRRAADPGRPPTRL